MPKQPPFRWTCPFCDRATTITEALYVRSGGMMELPGTEAEARYVFVEAIVCPNDECHRYSLEVTEYQRNRDAHGNNRVGSPTGDWRLIPASNAKVFPDHVPVSIRDDYTEACLVRNLSPKASATLSRRCLQGMIRDFWQVSGLPTLKREIEAIADRVEPLTWQAIDAVRAVGNIGAHMEQDINLIIDVEPEEAGLLIWLVERLMADWYLARHERERMLSDIVSLAATKSAAKETPGETADER